LPLFEPCTNIQKLLKWSLPNSLQHESETRGKLVSKNYEFTFLKSYSHPHPWRNFTPLTFVNCHPVRFANMHLAKSQHGQLQIGASERLRGKL